MPHTQAGAWGSQAAVRIKQGFEAPPPDVVGRQSFVGADTAPNTNSPVRNISKVS